MPLPIELEGLGKPSLRIVWGESHDCTHPPSELRVSCRCAHCVEEMTGRPLLDPNRVPRDLSIQNMEVAGNYGVRIAFTDGHDTGIYRFVELRRVCEEKQKLVV